MKAITYRRVSLSVEGRQDIDRQKKPITDFCNRKGFEIIEKADFTDEISGAVKTTERTGFKKLLKFIESYPNKKELNLVCDEISRMGRIKLDILNTIEKIIQYGVNVHFVSPECSYLNSLGHKDESADLIITLFAQLAESERNKIKHRISTSIHRTAQQGKSLGGKHIPYGYKVVDKMLVVNEEEAEIVREIFDIYNSGIGSIQIAEYLNNKGVKPRLGGLFQPTVIIQMTKNEMYKGIRKVNGENYSIPSIVSTELWNKVEQKRLNKEVSFNRERKRINPLVSKFRCECGGVIILALRNKKPSYVCHTRSQRGKKYCSHFLSASSDLINNAILTIYENMAKNVSKNEETIKQLKVEKKNINRINIPNLTSNLDDIDNRIDRANDLFIDGKLTSIKRDEKEAEILKDKEELKDKLQNYNERLVSIDKQIQSLKDGDDVNNIADIPTFKQFCQTKIDSITIKKVDKDSKPLFQKHFTHGLDTVFEINLKTFEERTVKFWLSSRTKKIIEQAIQDEEEFELTELEDMFKGFGNRFNPDNISLDTSDEAGCFVYPVKQFFE